jgi:hypothetical protein
MGACDGGAGRLQPGALLLGEGDGIGERERRRLGLDTRVEGERWRGMAPRTGPRARGSQGDVRVRGEPEASLHAGLGELRRQGHRPLPGGTASEEAGYEDSYAGELPPTSHGRPQGGPTPEERNDELSSAVHRSSSHQAYKGRYGANTDCHQFPSPSMGGGQGGGETAPPLPPILTFPHKGGRDLYLPQ